MIAIILLAISTAALCQFGLHYWRAMMAGVAEQPISDRVRTAARILVPVAGAGDFRSIVSLTHLAPNLQGGSRTFSLLRAYYSAVEKLGRYVPNLSDWSMSEMTTCARYVAVLVDRQLECNLACTADMRGL
jgi:hypothetical protein